MCVTREHSFRCETARLEEARSPQPLVDPYRVQVRLKTRARLKS
jgi:hypothetical protein